jgi:hypothetical protein
MSHASLRIFVRSFLLFSLFMTNPQTTVMIPPPFLRFSTGAAIIGMYLIVSGTFPGPTSEVVEIWILDPFRALTWSLVDLGRDDQVAILSVPGFRSALGEIPTSPSCSVTGIGATMTTRNAMPARHAVVIGL